MKPFDPRRNRAESRRAVGYTPPRGAGPDVYRRIGFRSGLEVHQQLLTRSKLFCRCPAGIYQSDGDYHAEILRHMRPTLSELGVYDGTALMEFKTRKEILYRIHNRTACTYDIDDTPPFPVDPEAVETGLRIALLCGLQPVGEIHIARKQYLDGSIPTGFQRTALLGVEGRIELRGGPVRVMQLSLEEDSCREISDIGHRRVFKTDRLGIPLVEIVTYPDMKTPGELAEAAEHIRYLTRSTGRVRTGIGAARQDVNVSCEGGSRVEIKGVSSIRRIPELSHNEVFRQAALLRIRSLLRARAPDPAAWSPAIREIGADAPAPLPLPVRRALRAGGRAAGILLPGCRGLLSHFTQPGRCFADELSERVRVIACIEKPNLVHSETAPRAGGGSIAALGRHLGCGRGDAWVAVFGPGEDLAVAVETVEERMRLAFDGVPGETRKARRDGTTVFERVLPGRDRMYPDTDSPPIPVPRERIEALRRELPVPVARRIGQFRGWGLPPDAQAYLLSRNLADLPGRIGRECGAPPRRIGCLLARTLKPLEAGMPGGRPEGSRDGERILEFFRHLASERIDLSAAPAALPRFLADPAAGPGRALERAGFRPRDGGALLSEAPGLLADFARVRRSRRPGAATDWVMGRLRGRAIGNVSLADLSRAVARLAAGGGGS